MRTRRGGGADGRTRIPGRSVVVTALVAVLCLVGIGLRAQIPEPGPARFAVAIGNAWVYPQGDLALKESTVTTDGRYATPGTAFVQRLMWAPFGRWGMFLQASFPSFGVDAEAVQRDFNRSPPVVGGANTITAWTLGVRWRQGRSWRRGPYAEAALERNRATLEVRQEGEEADSMAFAWETGWMVGAGWVVGLGPTLALDGGLAVHEFREDAFITRWTALRFMAVFTFGGNR